MANPKLKTQPIELRKDYILDRYVLISKGRAARPVQFTGQKKASSVNKDCFFCSGNESKTPKEIGRVEEKNSWKIRWFPNLFPFVSFKNNAKKESKKYYSSVPGLGEHEVIVDSNDHSKQLHDLDVEHLTELLKVISLRIKDLSKLKNVKYVSVFKNSGKDAGASLEHSHHQLATLNMIPPNVDEEIKASVKGKKCLYCDIIKKEAKSKRKVNDTKNFVTFCPYAPRFKYEAWIFPKKHLKDMNELDDSGLKELATHMHKILLKLRSIGAAYNIVYHYAPKGKNLHFHVEILPRIAKWAGFEHSTGVVVNSMPPEMAAKYYRSKD